MYTKKFTEELKKRIISLHGEELNTFLSENNVKTVDDYIIQLGYYQRPQHNEL